MSARPPAEVLAFDALDSTNAEARRQAEAGARGPLWITAARQSAGRGRRGRAWVSDPRNLAATLLVTTHRAPADAALVSFVAALAVADLMDAFAPPAVVSLKWPNDVLLDGRKAAGILVESGPAPGSGLWLAIGVGANLAWAPTEVERPATALADHLRGEVAAPPTPDAALAVLAGAFERRLALWETGGAPAVLAAWSARAAGVPGPCVARLGDGDVAGEAEGLEPDGALRLRTADGQVRRITAGDVFFGTNS